MRVALAATLRPVVTLARRWSEVPSQAADAIREYLLASGGQDVERVGFHEAWRIRLPGATVTMFHSGTLYLAASAPPTPAAVAARGLLLSMPHEVDLSGCKAKVEHGRRHMTELDNAVRAFFDDPGNCPAMVSTFDEESGFHIFRVGSIPTQLHELQIEAALRVGDVVHDLRSALDHLVWQLSLKGAGGSEPQDALSIQFPIASSAKDFESARRRTLRNVSTDHQDLIESYQPYHEGAGRPDSYSGPYIHQLTLLRQLSNVDKHRLLTTILSLSSGAMFSIPPDLLEPAEVTYMGFTLTTDLVPVETDNDFRLEEGAAFAKARLRGERLPDGTHVGRSMPSLGLEENRPIAPTLGRIADYVELILRGFTTEGT